MNAAYAAIYIALGLLGLAGIIGLGRFYARGGTVKAALQTVELLQAQVASLTSQVVDLTAHNAALTTTVGVLSEQVTQAAAVRKLSEDQSERFHETITTLARFEGSLSRIESKIMRGE